MRRKGGSSGSIVARASRRSRTRTAGGGVGGGGGVRASGGGVGGAGGEVLGALGAFEAFEVGHGEAEDAFGEEEDRAEGLVLGGGGGAAVHGEGVPEGGELDCAQGPGVTAVVEADELADPGEIGLLGA